MAWTSSEVLQFIENYRNEPVIWNPKNVHHKNKNKVNDAWSRIAENMHVPISELKRKKESLMTSFRIHNKKKNESIKSGMGEDERYTPIWPFYEPLEAFLKGVYECNSVINSYVEENEAQDSPLSPAHTEKNTNSATEIGCSAESSNSTPAIKTKSKDTALPQLKRRSKNPLELSEANREMKNAFNTLNKALEKNTRHEEDDCDLYGKLLAAKLRKFPDNEREDIMLEIDSMVMKRRRNIQTVANTYNLINRPPSSQSYQSEWSQSSSSPHNRPHSTQSTVSSYCTIPNKTSHSQPQFVQWSPNESKSSRPVIRILSNDIYSPAQTLQSSEQAVEFHIPESDEFYNNLQSESESLLDSQNIIFKAFQDA
ncbi:uncharacterized protein LOC125241694 [Leguminivora glycinivorella]|uniref:uncharacterized protein LOC125241694 n=1 Tax=Leguminivora glycinivorella TaxID=1035111 RepID=UPI00200DBFBA|nr:uncharacterized protein LOC125241694 [Leguminivora glycinivorella]